MPFPTYLQQASVLRLQYFLYSCKNVLTCCKLKGDRALRVLAQDTAPTKAKSKVCCDFIYVKDSVTAFETNIMKNTRERI